MFTLETLFQGFTSFFLVASTVWIAAATATAAVALRVFPFSIFPLYFFWAVSLLKQELTGDSSSSISACALVCPFLSLAFFFFFFLCWPSVTLLFLLDAIYGTGEEEGEEGEEWCAAFSFTFFLLWTLWPFDDDDDGTFVCHWLLWLIVQVCQSVSVCLCVCTGTDSSVGMLWLLLLPLLLLTNQNCLADLVVVVVVTNYPQFGADMQKTVLLRLNVKQ